ncbi:MAG: hypothetical protein CMN74_12230 [Sphingorhabdus sp.]|nr:hypothetical protein [Sphingorhabdus sp.]|tara:strand:+ start:862 stop:1134 length:273 start_codon:yes stop_codon:yes gene_type:complete
MANETYSENAPAKHGWGRRISKALNWALLITTIYLIGRFLDDVHRIADAERNNGSFYLCVEVLKLGGDITELETCQPLLPALSQHEGERS